MTHDGIKGLYLIFALFTLQKYNQIRYKELKISHWQASCTLKFHDNNKHEKL